MAGLLRLWMSRLYRRCLLSGLAQSSLPPCLRG
nr:MAG TPA: hypothetical protein [Caudoviricetes sp.]